LTLFTGDREPNISDWRAKHSATSTFRFDAIKSGPPILPDTAGHLALASEESDRLPSQPIPTADQTLPMQEIGKHNRLRIP
jgi:hypothetical protein